MSEVITSVGIDAHKRELHVAMLIGSAATPVTWTVENEPKPIARLHRSSSATRPARCGCATRRARAACAATAPDGRRGHVRRHCAGVDAAEAEQIESRLGTSRRPRTRRPATMHLVATPPLLLPGSVSRSGRSVL